MNKLSTKWQKVTLWLSGYLSIVAFILAGGYIYLKSEDDEVKNSAKKVLAVVAGFTVLSALISIIYNILSVFGAGYDAMNTISKLRLVVEIIKILTFGVMFIFDFFSIKLIAGENGQTQSSNTDSTDSDKSDD